MIYDFDTPVDRSENHAAKYDERLKKFGREDVIPLWIADMDFRTAQPVIDALTARAQQGLWGYTARPDSYFDAICDWQRRRNGWEIDRSLLSWSLGVVQSLSAIVKNFTPEGGNVLIQTPVYSEFYDVTEAWDRTVLENPLIEENGRWRVDYDDLERKLRQADLFIFCSPHNPLGILWSREEVERIARLCLKYKVLMVSDEIHADLVFWGGRHTVAAALGDDIAANVITCFSGTKTFNLAGLQASAVVFPNAELKQKFDGFWRKLDIHRNNAFSLTAMEAAFRYGEEWLEQLKTYLEGNFLFIRDYCAANIPEIVPIVPAATYLVWLDCRQLGLDNGQLHDFMINQARLGLNDGNTFGRSLSGYMRLNAACPRCVLARALEQLRAAVDTLRGRG